VSYSKNNISTWTQHIQGVCGEFETRFDGQSSLFIGEVKSFLLGQTEIAFIKSNASFIERKPEILDRAKDRFCFLILQYTGKMLLKYRNETLFLSEGDIVLLDSNEHIAMYPQGLFSHISVHLSRDKLFKQGITAEHFGKLISRNMSAHLLKNMLQTMSSDNIEFWYAKEDGNAFEDALIALMKPTIHYKNIQVSDSLKLKAERYILENLMQSSLSPKVVADHIGVSLRHLYRLFMVDQQSINKYIQMKRLEKVQFELKDLKNKKLSITEIALRWGFGDSAHFSKIFKKVYGISPSQYRAVNQNKELLI
jgi:AraC family transcriptional regulator, positive regulator of tynA and feaB